MKAAPIPFDSFTLLIHQGVPPDLNPNSSILDSYHLTRSVFCDRLKDGLMWFYERYDCFTRTLLQTDDRGVFLRCRFIYGGGVIMPSTGWKTVISGYSGWVAKSGRQGQEE